MYEIFENPVLISSKKYVNNLFTSINCNLFFHQYNHSLEVLYRSIELGEKEGLGNEDLEMLAIAAIFHDSGFSVQYDKNEKIGAKIAEKFLKNFGYPEKKIKVIKNIIIATIIEKEPSNILEKIIKDADLDNLGRDDFFDKTKALKKEIETIKNKKIDLNDWYNFALNLAYKQKFYTKTSNSERLLKKIKNIKKLEKILKK